VDSERGRKLPVVPPGVAPSWGSPVCNRGCSRPRSAECSPPTAVQSPPLNDRCTLAVRRKPV